MFEDRLETRDRDFDFTLTRAAEDGDGLTLEGTAAVFNTPARIQDRQGEYDEIIAPGAFRQLERSGRMPVFMFNHGKHPLWGEMPIGTITELHEDHQGLQIRARLLAHDFFAPIREAIGAKAIPGMSFRFDPVKGKQDWQMRGKGQPPLCVRRELRVPELGPCISPAYVETGMALRSIFQGLERTFPGVMNVQILGETRDMMMDDDCTDPQQLVTEAVASHWSLRDPLAWVEMHDDHMIFGVGDNDISDHRGLWRVDFTITDSVPAISEPVQVTVTPAGAAPRSLELVGNVASTSAAISEIRAAATASEIDNLPDSAFAYIEPGGTKDASGKTVPRSKRHFPIHDEAHVRNALARMSQSPFGEKAKPAIMAAAKKFGIDTTMRSQDLGTSEEAVEDTSGEAAEQQVRSGPLSMAQRRQYVRQIELERRGITRKASNG